MGSLEHPVFLLQAWLPAGAPLPLLPAYPQHTSLTPHPPKPLRHLTSGIECLRFIKFSRLHLHKPLYGATQHQRGSLPCGSLQPGGDTTRSSKGHMAPDPPRDHTHPGIVSGEGVKAQPELLSNQIFTALSDRSLSHLRGIFYMRDTNIMQ